MYAVMEDGGYICHRCVLDHYRLIYRHTQDDCQSGWSFGESEINWEDEMRCDNCSNQIESAYEVTE